ncbi:hypothetical protein P8C59_004613 [Phyllachora maydis]|uniref:Uncharacterized protein n=1 Tax=Phyllachora maydis TaxID=1825666 RepID=A0AAD9I2P6_9PEZI|nr:hypothetical protein P8C59_004613 [Phyllachora maydis]
MAAFRPVCVRAAPAIVGSGSSVTTGDAAADNPSTISPQASDFRDPFYASTFPQCYALAATTVIAYLLVIMLFITPRSFLDGGIVVLGRRGFTNGGTGVNIGGRPWLQKVATLTVAISLTIATVDTFREAEEQYAFGIENAVQMQAVVLGGTELKVIRIISGTFLWLAQAQTLIRLFPRHREKVIIKWTAFALITLDVIFQCLDSFQYTSQGATRPRNFTDAVPALSYLFELSLGVLYAAWVIYYSLIKKRYAFYHAKMRNMSGRWDIKSRLEDFAATQAEKLREKVKPTPDTASLPVRVIPAPPRPGAALAQLREEEEQQLREEPATFNELPQRTNSDASASASASGSGSSQLQTPTTWQSLHERPHYSRTPPALPATDAPSMRDGPEP